LIDYGCLIDLTVMQSNKQQRAETMQERKKALDN
jgi:hypothetical protein